MIRAIIAAWLLAILASTAHAARAGTADAWPREIELSDAAVVIYQPFIGAWEGNRLDFCAVIEVRVTGRGENQIFGAIWGVARTRVDRGAGSVTLSGLRLLRSDFLTLSVNDAAHLRGLQKQLKRVVVVVGLDRLEASLAESRREEAGRSGARDPRRRRLPVPRGRMIAV